VLALLSTSGSWGQKNVGPRQRAKKHRPILQPYPGPGGKWQVSTEGGESPIWARDGRELFYRSGDKLMAVDVQTAPEFKTSAPHVLFESRFSGYAVAPDGRFLVVRPAQDTGPAQLQVVVGWFDELREKLGAASKRP
jgi:hypothetical protein